MLVIPAIDLIDGKCVRLFKGDYAKKKVYDEDPAARARLWESGGAKIIHLVDLNGAREGQSVNLEAIKKIRSAVSCILELGGGIRSFEDAKRIFDLGIDRVVIGTGALRNRLLVESLVELYPGRVILGADAKGGRLAVEAWQSVVDEDVYDFAASFNSLPLAGVIYTDVETDGALIGPNLKAQQRMSERITSPLIASGGISSLEDLVLLARAGIKRLYGVIVGTALYEERFSLPEAIKELANVN